MQYSCKQFATRTTGALLAATGLLLVPTAGQATTNTFVFNNTVLAASVGPNNPVNGSVAFYGTNLTAGDVLVFDGIVYNNNAASTGSDWAGVSLNGSGTGGVTGATLGVLLRDGNGTGYYCSMWTNAVTLGNLGTTPSQTTNRCHIEVTCTQTGSTTNMNYLVEVDQGLTGTYSWVQSGTGLTFNYNVIGLAFGTRNNPQTFIQNQPNVSIASVSPGTNTVVGGAAATFSTSLTAGWPGKVSAQWLSNGVAILGATNLTYTTPPVTASYNGAHYSVIVSNLQYAANVVTSTVALLNVRTTPGLVPFNFPVTTVADGGYYGPVTDPGVAISGSGLLVGDTVVFDGIVTPNGSQASDAWISINVAGGGYGNLTGAQLGVLTRLGAGPSQLFINGAGSSSNPTSGGSLTNRVHIELYPSANGSTTNMGWLVEFDQGLTGTFLPAVTGTNLTFPNNTLPLTFGSSGNSAFVYQDPQSPVSIFSQPAASQIVAVGAPITVGVTVSGWYPAFQWRKNGVSIPNATNQTYTVAAAGLGDNGDQFTVVVSNRLSSLNVVTSTVANVSVLIPNNLSWYPTADQTTWDTVTPNWTTNGGASQAVFATGNNVTFDSLGIDAGGSSVTITNAVNPNGVTVNVTGGNSYNFSGAGKLSSQSLLLTGDGSGSLYLQLPAVASFANATIASGTLQVGNGGGNSDFEANYITNNGTLDFQNPSGTLTVSGVITGTGSIIQDGAGTTVLSATNSACTILAINNGSLAIASTPNPGVIFNDAELQAESSASVLTIPNAMTGSGHYYFSGFQTTVLTGASSHTGENILFWSDVIVDNAQALGDPYAGSSQISGGDRFGGLYLSNSITWTQPLELDSRFNTGVAATAPQVENFSGTNIITSPLTFDTGVSAGQVGTEWNLDATAGLLVVDASSTLVNNSIYYPMNLNLQGAATGIWNAVLIDGGTALNVVKRGTGTWTLGGQNYYSGTTTVAAGTLLITNQISSTAAVTVQAGAELGGNGGIIYGPVTVASGGTLAPGLPVTNGPGLLTINANLTLAAGSLTSVQVSHAAATNDQITGVGTLTYGGTLVVTNLAGTLTSTDTFKLFSASTYAGAFAAVSPTIPGPGLGWNTNTLATDGTLRIIVTNTLATNPTNITASVVSGNRLQLTWPADHVGWILQSSTNLLGTNWFQVVGSTATNSVFVPITGTPAQFFRLVNQ